MQHSWLNESSDVSKAQRTRGEARIFCLGLQPPPPNHGDDERDSAKLKWGVGVMPPVGSRGKALLS